MRKRGRSEHACVLKCVGLSHCVLTKLALTDVCLY